MAVYILAEAYYQMEDFVKVNFVLHKNGLVLRDENFLLLSIRSLKRIG